MLSCCPKARIYMNFHLKHSFVIRDYWMQKGTSKTFRLKVWMVRILRLELCGQSCCCNAFPAVRLESQHSNHTLWFDVYFSDERFNNSLIIFAVYWLDCEPCRTLTTDFFIFKSGASTLLNQGWWSRHFVANCWKNVNWSHFELDSVLVNKAFGIILRRRKQVSSAILNMNRVR